MNESEFGSLTGDRTPITNLKGWRPVQLDDKAKNGASEGYQSLYSTVTV